MNTEMRTLDDIENEWQAKMAELSGVENNLLKMHEKEWELRTDLQHLEIQRTRLKQAAGEVS